MDNSTTATTAQPGDVIMVDELTRAEVSVLTSMCESILLGEVCLARSYRQKVIGSLIGKQLVRKSGIRIMLTSYTMAFVSQIIEQRLAELTPEGKAQTMEDIMDGHYG